MIRISREAIPQLTQATHRFCKMLILGKPLVVCFVLVWVLEACSPHHRRTEEVDGPTPLGDVAVQLEQDDRFWNPSIGSAEMERRLRARVSVNDGVFLLHASSGFGDSYLLPANAPWVMSCGFGVTIYFGAAVTGTGGDSENIATLMLVSGLVPRKVCDEIGPALGVALEELLAAAPVDTLREKR